MLSNRISPCVPGDRKSYPTGEANAFFQRLGHFAIPPDGKRLPDSGNRMVGRLRLAFFHSSVGSFGFSQPIFLSTAR
jgi:hypothetical protein